MKKTILVSSSIIALCFLSGCAGITFASVIQDAKGWATGANVLWTDVKQKKTPEQVKADLIAGGTSEQTAAAIVYWLPVINGVVDITPELVSSVDAMVKAATK